METIKVRIDRTYKFVKDDEKGCELCDLHYLCKYDWCECQEGEAGYYELDDEQIEELPH